MISIENLFLIDWLSFTSKSDSVETIVNKLGLIGNDFTDMYGMQGYANRFYLNGISIHFNSARNEGVWVEMSGQGCRAFESLSTSDWFSLFDLILNDDYNITRLDVAFDDHSGIIPLKKIANDVRQENYVSKFKARSITCTFASGDVGYTIDLGSRKSAIKFRIYDKAFERNREEEGHWVRCECQLRDERATEFLKKLDTENVSDLFLGVLVNYIRFVTPSTTDTDKHRWKLRKYWSNFVGAVEAVSLYTNLGLDYNLAKCENFVYRQCGNALDTLIKIKGVESVVVDLNKNKPPKKAPKYLDLINSNKCIENDEILNYVTDKEKIIREAERKKKIESYRKTGNTGILEFLSERGAV